MTDLDAEIAEFHRAARKRKARVFAVAAVVSILIGVAAIIVSVTVTEPDAPGVAKHYEIRTVLVGIGFVVFGVFSAVNAYRIGTGQIDDAP